VPLSKFELARVKKTLDFFMAQRRPPPHIGPKLDLGSRISGQNVSIFEIRPVWRGSPGERHESAVAKATYVRTRGVWRVFWMRRDLKWHSYDSRASGRLDHAHPAVKRSVSGRPAR
jgi:Protein of unknown function (DUF3024)